jgi:hypothetical protein
MEKVENLKMRWIEDIFGLMFLPVAVLLVLLLVLGYCCKRGIEMLFKE